MSGHGSVHRLCYMGKINEKILKGDAEKPLTDWATNVVETCEVTEEGEELGEYTGF